MKILGIDYGRRKVGVAVGDTVTKLAEPLKTVENFKFLYSEGIPRRELLNLKSISNDQIIKKIVIGVPGGEIDCEVREFGKRIEKETGIPVEYFDETLTTQDAQKVLIESGGRRKKREQKEDAMAAALMLQYYLETRLC